MTLQQRLDKGREITEFLLKEAKEEDLYLHIGRDSSEFLWFWFKTVKGDTPSEEFERVYHGAQFGYFEEDLECLEGLEGVHRTKGPSYLAYFLDSEGKATLRTWGYFYKGQKRSLKEMLQLVDKESKKKLLERCL